MKVRTKAHDADALQWNGSLTEEVTRWLNERSFGFAIAGTTHDRPGHLTLTVSFPGGATDLRPTDWIIDRGLYAITRTDAEFRDEFESPDMPPLPTEEITP